MRIWMLSVVFVERKAVDFKDKNAGCEGGIIRKKLPSLARLNGNSAAFLSATAACILHVQAAADASLSGRTAQIAQLRSTRSSVNSGEKPAGFYEELTQKTEPKFAKTSSVFFFLRNRRYFSCVFCYNSSLKTEDCRVRTVE